MRYFAVALISPLLIMIFIFTGIMLSIALWVKLAKDIWKEL